jgi:hypothetical protein
MNEEERPEWWQVQVGNLIDDPEKLRAMLERMSTNLALTTLAMRHWEAQAERARAWAVRLEGELARLEEKSS